MIRSGLILLFVFGYFASSSSAVLATTCQSEGAVFNVSDIVWSKHHKAHLYCAGNSQWRYLAQWGLTGTNNLAVVDGNIGIGTAEPLLPLDVQFMGDSGLRVKNTGSDNASIYVDAGSGASAGSYLRFQKQGADTFAINTDENNHLHFRPKGGNASVIFMSDGRVSIGTNTGMNAMLFVATPDTVQHGGQFIKWGTSGSAVYGWANSQSGSTSGGAFYNASSSGRAVHGEATATTGTAYGGSFLSYSTSGYGVFARASGASGTTYGVYGEVSSPNGFGVYSKGNARIEGNFSTTGTVDVANNRILRVADPTISSDAANKAYVDSLGGQTCSNGQILKYQSDAWQCAADNSGGGADNLGNHKASQDLDMAGYKIKSASGVAASTIGGTTGASTFRSDGDGATHNITVDIRSVGAATSSTSLYADCQSGTNICIAIRGGTSNNSENSSLGGQFYSGGATSFAYGIQGSASNGGHHSIGVEALAGGNTPHSYGIRASSSGGSSSSFGIRAETTAAIANSYGGYFRNSHTSGTTYGVYGDVQSPDGFGVYSKGNAHVQGNLSTSGTIDAADNRILRVATPTASTDAANKAYVDTLGGRTSSTSGQILKWNGSSWQCSHNAVLPLASNEPMTCNSAINGQLAVTSVYRTCVCRSGTGWVETNDGSTPCVWALCPTRTYETSGTYSCYCDAAATAASGTVWGTDYYTHDSRLCKAAVHAGEVTIAGGAISYTVIPGHSSYKGSTRNGVTTSSYGTWSRSIYFGSTPPPTSEACETGPVGTPCSDGAIYAGTLESTNTRLYAASADEATGLTWNNGTTNWTETGVRSLPGVLTDGLTNTNTLIALSDAGAPYKAAAACRARGSGWYLPALDELNELFKSKDTVGGFTTTGSYYWSSFEYYNYSARVQRFSDGNQNDNYMYTTTRLVRCVRR